MRNSKFRGKEQWLLVLLCLFLFLNAGCGSSTMQDSQIEPVESEEKAATTTPATISESMVEQEADTLEIDYLNPPEGYVYDFQVGTEPIPEEIAALGGMVTNTVHAYPSKIIQELTRLEIEENDELREKFEYFEEPTRKYLEEKYGEEVELVPYRNDKLFETDCYYYNCIPEGKIDELYIAYAYKLRETDIIVMDQKYYCIDTNLFAKYPEIFYECFGKNIIVKCYNLSNVQPAMLKVNQFGMPIGHLVDCVYVFTDETVDRISEQKKIVNYWDKMYAQNEILWGSIFVIYMPLDMKSVIEEKHIGSNYFDYMSFIMDENYEQYISKQIITDIFGLEFTLKPETGFYTENENIDKCREYLLSDIEKKELKNWDINAAIISEKVVQGGNSYE